MSIKTPANEGCASHGKSVRIFINLFNTVHETVLSEAEHLSDQIEAASSMYPAAIKVQYIRHLFVISLSTFKVTVDLQKQNFTSYFFCFRNHFMVKILT